ncbi:hypothetical protein X739_04020 [Mesorhizobium sp. LNHC220B00]|nr:hypothetical protein X739_04020 [Mesorhizobium sp. LNHC220B00]
MERYQEIVIVGGTSGRGLATAKMLLMAARGPGDGSLAGGP